MVGQCHMDGDVVRVWWLVGLLHCEVAGSSSVDYGRWIRG